MKLLSHYILELKMDYTLGASVYIITHTCTFMTKVARTHTHMQFLTGVWRVQESVHSGRHQAPLPSVRWRLLRQVLLQVHASPLAGVGQDPRAGLPLLLQEAPQQGGRREEVQDTRK